MRIGIIDELETGSSAGRMSNSRGAENDRDKKVHELVRASVGHHRGRCGKEYQGAESENTVGETGTCINLIPRHVEVLVESLGLENGNRVQAPTVDDVKDENPVWLDPVQISKCESHLARCLCLSQDRTVTTFAMNEMCQGMARS